VIVFVIDAVDHSSHETSKEELHKLIQWPSLVGIPLLVLGNKNDLEGALTEEEIIETMNLRSIKDRKVACFSISAKNVVNIDITIKWLTSLPKKEKKEQDENE
jgi:signal recognition particle receptor subunit beta